MDYEKLKSLIMAQAAEKGFGTTPDKVSIPEKMVLIHSEISEAYDAFSKGILGGKDGFWQELGDVLQRTLHLGGVYGIDFSSNPNFNKMYIKEVFDNEKFVRLHKIASDAWEAYRHQNEEGFKSKLVDLAYATNEMAKSTQFNLEEAVLAKIESNKSRVWDWKNLNESYKKV